MYNKSATEYTKTCKLHFYPVYQSVTSPMTLGVESPGLYTGISVSDKVYEGQCQLHCYPEYQSVTQGIVAYHLKCAPEYQSATKYMKSCQLNCTPMYQSVTWGVHLECIDILEYRSATKYTKTCQLHCSPVYQSVTWDITAHHPECFVVYFVADR